MKFEYYVNVLSKDKKNDGTIAMFYRYQDAKRCAKVAAADPNNLDVWIDGFESLKADLDF